MSGSEGEAIVVNSAVEKTPGGGKEIRSDDQTKMCSGCRVEHSLSQFQGTHRNEGKEMRTCMACRTKQVRIHYGSSPTGSGKTTPASPDEPARNGRQTRRQTTSNSTATTFAVVNKHSTGTPATTTNKPTTSYTMPTRPTPFRKSLRGASPAPDPTIVQKPTRSSDHVAENTDSEEDFYQSSAPQTRSLKRRSTPPHAANEDTGRESAIQVRQPPPKRQRINAAPIVQREIQHEPEPELDDEGEEGEPILNSNGHPVGSDLAAFAASLGRLSQLLVTAGKNLDHERIGALESEIHHDWRVDEMATFVEGFLKGASANAAGKGW